MKKISIAIDGPAGAGKSTIAKLIAEKLSLNYVDTGAMYRTIALFFHDNNIIDYDKINMNDLLEKIDIEIKYENHEQINYLNGKNINNYIRTSEISNIASSIAIYKEVRDKLVNIQRQIVLLNDVVMDGRDIGTHVIPDATLKIYLNASIEERAYRRYLDLKEKGIDEKLDEIKSDIAKRDNRDMNREFAPLVKAVDAYEINTTNLDINEVVDKIMTLMKFEEM